MKIPLKTKFLKLELKGFLIFSQWFFRFWVNLWEIWYLTKKKKQNKNVRRVKCTPKSVGGGTCSASPCLKMPFHHVTGISYISSRWSDVCRLLWFDLFLVNLYFFSLYSLEKYSLVLFIVGISTSIIILFISNFYSWSFYRNFIFFQFCLSIPSHILFFSKLVFILLIF